MPSISEKYLITHLILKKESSGFLFGDYGIKAYSPSYSTHYYDMFGAMITISKRFTPLKSYFPNPNIIGYFHCGDDKSPLYYLPKSLNRRFHTKYEANPWGHLLLIEHPEDEETIEITIVHQAAHSPYWGLYVKAWENGEFEDRINQLKSKLIYIGE